MSTIVIAACWPLQIPPTPKAVLISLADNANDQGVCWPSLETIQMRTCFGRSAVIEAIKWLEAHGLLVADRSNGRKTSYQVIPNGRAPQLFDGAGKPAKQSGKQTRPAGGLVQQADGSGRQTGSADGQNQSGSRTQPVRQPDTNRQEPSGTVVDDARAQATAPGELAAGILKVLGITCGITSQHPTLIEAAAAGVTAQAVIDLRNANPTKPAIYALTAALNQRRDVLAGAAPAGGQRARAGPARTRANDDFSSAQYVGTPDHELPAELR